MTNKMITSNDYEEVITELEKIIESPVEFYLKFRRAKTTIQRFRRKCNAAKVPSIKEIVANAYNVTPESLNVVTRVEAIKQARHMAIWFYYNYTKRTMGSIASEFYDGTHIYSHCTILYAIGKINDICDVDKSVKKDRDKIAKNVELYYKKVERESKKKTNIYKYVSK